MVETLFLLSLENPIIHALPVTQKKWQDTFEKFDLFWPRVTWNDLNTSFREGNAKSLIFIKNFQTLRQLWNLTQNDPKFVIWPKT